MMVVMFINTPPYNEASYRSQTEKKINKNIITTFIITRNKTK